MTAVELLPVNEFEEADTDRVNPFTGEPLLNLWGYQPTRVLRAEHRLLVELRRRRAGARVQADGAGASIAAGIEVILDMVFNHTAEGDEHGPTWSFRGIDNPTYYILDPETGEYVNFTGCGNTVNCNNPVVRDFIVDCLRYWVIEMHVDGFRFDLASILGRGQDGSVLTNPPLLESLAYDPVLANTKLIAEAWDAAGLYQVGTFPSWGRWAEWNGKFRDDVRKFVKGDPGMTSALATRLLGSPDLYETSAREPYHSINFVTCHDGFTLNDLVSYNEKHNLANGENNRDGANDNHSWNCGVEGPTDDRGDQRAARAAAQELRGDPAAGARRAHDPGRRRVRAHAAGQQQRLLPGQRDQLGRLAHGRTAMPICCASSGCDRLPQALSAAAPLDSFELQRRRRLPRHLARREAHDSRLGLRLAHRRHATDPAAIHDGSRETCTSSPTPTGTISTSSCRRSASASGSAWSTPRRPRRTTSPKTARNFRCCRRRATR